MTQIDELLLKNQAIIMRALSVLITDGTEPAREFARRLIERAHLVDEFVKEREV